MSDADKVERRSWFSSPAGRGVGWVVAIALFVCYVTFQVMPLLGDRGTGRIGLASHQNDYKHVYLGSRLLAEGLSPYEPETMLTMAGSYYGTVDPRFRTILPYVYLPFTGLVLEPLAQLPFPASVVAFQILNHLFILGGLGLVAWLGVRLPRNAWTAAGLLLFVAFNTAVYRQNNAGQLNAVLVFGMALLFVSIARGWHDAAIGFIAAFLMLFKLSPGIFLLYFLARAEWKRAGWMIGWAVVLSGISIAAFPDGFQRQLDFIPVLRDMGYGKSTWAVVGNTFWRDAYNESFNALFHRLFAAREGSGITPWIDLGPGAANGMTWVVSLGILVLSGTCLWRSRARTGIAEAAPFALAICASLLLPSIMWDHYLTQLLVPMVLIWGMGNGEWGMGAGDRGTGNGERCDSSSLSDQADPTDRSSSPEESSQLSSDSRFPISNPPPHSPFPIPRSLVPLSLALLITCLPVPLDAESFRAGAGLFLMNLKLIPVLLVFLIAVMRSWRVGSS